MESTLFKIVNVCKHSGILFGPLTLVYGVGIISIILLNKYLFKKIKNKELRIIVEFIILTLILSIIECLGGNILNYLFDIDMWNYTKKAYNFGKYVCLGNSLIWGLLGTLYIHIFKKFTDKILKVITNKETIFFLILLVLDIIATLYKYYWV